MAKCAKDINEQSPWQELTPGGEIYEGGTARMTITGEWRANIPVWDPQKCKQCLLCAPPELPLTTEAVVCRVQAVHPSETEPRQDMTLFMALPKGDKMEFVIQKSVELGVRKIVPFLSKNCVSRPDKTDKKVERWRKIAVEAAKQCGRGYLPVVTAVESAEKAFAMASDSGTALFFYENEKRGLRETLEGQGVSDTVSLVVGPEGGFAPEEVQAAQNAGLSSVSLGTRILRCETAPVAALAAVLYAGGNM